MTAGDVSKVQRLIPKDAWHNGRDIGISVLSRLQTPVRDKIGETLTPLHSL